MAAPFQRAEPPRLPEPSTAQLQAKSEQHSRLHKAEVRERRSMVRGVVLLALLVLLLSIARAGLDRVFPHGWWKP